MIDSKTTIAALSVADNILKRFSFNAAPALCKNEAFYEFCKDEINCSLSDRQLPSLCECFKTWDYLRSFIQETLYVGTDEYAQTPFESRCIDGLVCDLDWSSK